MKKLKYFLLLLLCAFSVSAISISFTSCDKDDDEEMFVGQSEKDFQPAEYYISMTYDNITEKTDPVKFDNRKLAEAWFDLSVSELKNDKEMATDYKGKSIALKLMRGNDIIKKATVTF